MGFETENCKLFGICNSARNLFAIWWSVYFAIVYVEDFSLTDGNVLKYEFSFSVGAQSGSNERRLLNDLLEYYNMLERPVFNDSEAINLTFGLTLQQIIDVVSQQNKSIR